MLLTIAIAICACTSVMMITHASSFINDGVKIVDDATDLLPQEDSKVNYESIQLPAKASTHKKKYLYHEMFDRVSIVLLQ